jgi:hydrogenase maturation protease
VTVAGVGNWLVCQDRVGPRVLEMAAGRYGEDVELADIGSGGLALLDHLHGQNLLVVVDACFGRGQPGDVVVIDVEQIAAATSPTVHQIGPAEALLIARHLQPETMPQRTVLLLAETGELDESQLDTACERVMAELDALIREAHSAPAATQPRIGGGCARQQGA